LRVSLTQATVAGTVTFELPCWLTKLMYWIGVARVIGVMSIVVWSTASPKFSVCFSAIG